MTHRSGAAQTSAVMPKIQPDVPPLSKAASMILSLEKKPDSGGMPMIAAAFEREGWTGWLYGGAALLGAGLTAFYMTRLFILTFHGPKRWTEDIHEPHESPYIMTVPLMVLALGSIRAARRLGLDQPPPGP